MDKVLRYPTVVLFQYNGNPSFVAISSTNDEPGITSLRNSLRSRLGTSGITRIDGFFQLRGEAITRDFSEKLVDIINTHARTPDEAYKLFEDVLASGNKYITTGNYKVDA